MKVGIQLVLLHTGIVFLTSCTGYSEYSSNEYDYDDDRDSTPAPRYGNRWCMVASRDNMGLVVEKKCCPGYKKVDNYCEPICTPECVNATCTRPGECDCHEGYIAKNSFTCELECPEECEHPEHCDDGKCVCISGYNRINSTSCMPNCPNCENGRCSRPYLCRCNEHYQKNYDTNKCEPVCSLECVNGKCSAPDTCKCNPGYEKNVDFKSWNVCFPTCKEECGDNSYCSGVNICSCDIGYRMMLDNETSCLPICKDECFGGTCMMPDFCNCDPGHVKMAHNRCIPECNNTIIENCSLSHSFEISKSITALQYDEFVVDSGTAFFLKDAVCEDIVKNDTTTPYSCYTDMDFSSTKLFVTCTHEEFNRTLISAVRPSFNHSKGSHLDLDMTIYHPTSAGPKQGCHICVNDTEKLILHEYTQVNLYICTSMDDGFSFQKWIIILIAILSISTIAGLIYIKRHQIINGFNRSQYGRRFF